MQGHLAHETMFPPLETPYGPRHMLLKGPRGGAVSHERGTPVDCEKEEMFENTLQLMVFDLMNTVEILCKASTINHQP